MNLRRFRRTVDACALCGATGRRADVQWRYSIPLDRGGLDEPGNRARMCAADRQRVAYGTLGPWR